MKPNAEGTPRLKPSQTTDKGLGDVALHKCLCCFAEVYLHKFSLRKFAVQACLCKFLCERFLCARWLYKLSLCKFSSQFLCWSCLGTRTAYRCRCAISSVSSPCTFLCATSVVKGGRCKFPVQFPSASFFVQVSSARVSSHVIFQCKFLHASLSKSQ